MTRAGSFICGAFCLSVVSSCVTSQYPADWPAPVASSSVSCPDPSGTYKNAGTWDDGDQMAMAALFFPVSPTESSLKAYELEAVSHLSIERLDERNLHIQAWVGDEFYSEERFSEDRFSCSDGKFIIQDSSWHFGGVPPFLPVVYHSSIERSLSLATDGSLLMENHELSTGAALIVPLGLKAQYWFRFPPLDAEAIAAPPDPDSPSGVRSGSEPDYGLNAPINARSWTGYDDAENCVKHALGTGATEDSRAPALLGGRSTQAFLLQSGRHGTLQPSGTVVGSNWLPRTHALNIGKLHWQPAAVADNYILCMLDKGYSWDADS